jgi:hypothetical protein
MTNDDKLSRRRFVKTVVGSAAAATLIGHGAGSIEAFGRTLGQETDMPLRSLGVCPSNLQLYFVGVPVVPPQRDTGTVL